ncbi:unnamed protein product [Polarella glacialis]|uniref:PET hydrolase/cutinase-like domain-containing protein n=1 Tax=Polarella glacialis TaxID=89957 RepID=A0A813KJ14_POLGL|nr:unnamed protein product [Polarella glacialis]
MVTGAAIGPSSPSSRKECGSSKITNTAGSCKSKGHLWAGTAAAVTISTLLIISGSAPPTVAFPAGMKSAPSAGSKPGPKEPRELRELRDPHSFEALVHEPEKGQPGQQLPLLLYLHGAGEQAGGLRDILSEGATGTPPVELAKGSALSILADRFVVVAPHTSRGWRPEAVGKFLDFLLDSSSSGLQLDPRRLYITGHSMGGAGALMAAAATRRFAAVVPVAPSGAPKPADLRGIPVWAFHGRNDIIVPSQVSEQLLEALRRSEPSDDARLTLYDDAPAPVGWPDYLGHASTIPAYAMPELYDWLLSHQLPNAAPKDRDLSGDT